MIEETVIENKVSPVSIIISFMNRKILKRFKIGNFDLFFIRILGVVSYFFSLVTVF